MQFTKAQMKAARRADLFEFLTENHPSEIQKEGASSLFLKNDHSIHIKKGYSGYIDFATDETGNAVDFLVDHMGYSIPEAVLALCDEYSLENIEVDDDDEETPEIDLSETPIDLPIPLEGRYRQLFAYLMHRGIPAKSIQKLIDEKVLYQEESHNNAVFVNKERDFAEIHGTLSFGKSFHSCRKTKADRFWWFKTDTNADTAYICEAAIDAISLSVLIKEPAYYISLGGVANQKTIDRIKRQPFLKRIVLAVDNDDAGQLRRDINHDLVHLIPIHKDWNEDLMAR